MHFVNSTTTTKSSINAEALMKWILIEQPGIDRMWNDVFINWTRVDSIKIVVQVFSATKVDRNGISLI